MPRACPLVEGFACPMMPGLGCGEAGGPEELAQCRRWALEAGYLAYDATGRFSRKLDDGWRPGEGPEWRRRENLDAK